MTDLTDTTKKPVTGSAQAVTAAVPAAQFIADNVEAFPALPETIRSKLRADATATNPATNSPASAGEVKPSLQPMAERLQHLLPEARAMAGRGVAAARERMGALALARPSGLVLKMPSVPRISPELRQKLVKHGRAAGMNIGTTLDKIIREAPASPILPATPSAADVDTGSADIKTLAIQRAVKQPSIFAPGHILTALLAGGIIHIATTFAITSIGTGSAFRQLRSVLPTNELVIMPVQTPATQLLPFLAPDMLYAICRFDLSAGPLEIKALLPEAGWSLALYTRQGDNFYAAPGQSQRPVPVAFSLSVASDRLVNLTPGVRKSDVDLSQVTSPETDGLLVVRAPLKGVAFEASARADLKRASCAPARK